MVFGEWWDARGNRAPLLHLKKINLIFFFENVVFRYKIRTGIYFVKLLYLLLA